MVNHNRTATAHISDIVKYNNSSSTSSNSIDNSSYIKNNITSHINDDKSLKNNQNNYDDKIDDELEQLDAAYDPSQDDYADDDDYDDDDNNENHDNTTLKDEQNDDNDDDDDYDDDDEEDDVHRTDLAKDRSKSSKIKNAEIALGHSTEEHLYSTRRKTGTNDAIKIISTPHGKVGILYQSSASSSTADSLGIASKQFNPNQRITPVLTADGKVALLYRGANSDLSSKYEPIINLNKFLDNNNETTTLSSPTSSSSSSSTSTTINNEATLLVQHIKMITSSTSTTTSHPPLPRSTPPLPVQVSPFRGPSLRMERVDNEEDNSILLPNINRPLSEVLGIKKNQFTQFRIPDHQQTSTSTSVVPSSSSTFTVRAPDIPNYEYDYDNKNNNNNNNNKRIENGRFENSQIRPPPQETIPQDDDDGHRRSTDSIIDDVLSRTDVVNFAIIPAFDSDLQAIQTEHDEANAADANIGRKHHRHRSRYTVQELSAIHCTMQAMVAIAALATVLGMLGAYFRTRVLHRMTVFHWQEVMGVRFWVGLSRRGVFL